MLSEREESLSVKVVICWEYFESVQTFGQRLVSPAGQCTFHFFCERISGSKFTVPPRLPTQHTKRRVNYFFLQNPGWSYRKRHVMSTLCYKQHRWRRLLILKDRTPLNALKHGVMWIKSRGDYFEMNKVD